MKRRLHSADAFFIFCIKNGVEMRKTDMIKCRWKEAVREKTNGCTILMTAMLLLLGSALIWQGWKKRQEDPEVTETAAAGKQPYVVVIDAGHGGRDGGKVSVDGTTYEKDVNLAIAGKLRTYLEAENITVIMTREGDEGLYTEADSNKKAADLKHRIEMIDHAVPDLVVSIHQNSYHEPQIKGAQVFYYTTSEEGSRLAGIIQNQLRVSLDPDNHREAKANNTYYLLKKTEATIVIVECGFLSNPEEAALLKTAEYQDRVAWNIHLGIMQYLNCQQNS